MIVTPITHEPIPKPVWDVHMNGRVFPGLTVWDVHMNRNLFLGLTLWDVDETFLWDSLCGMYL